MILYHWTPGKNLHPVLRQGLDPSLAKGGMKVVWLGDKQRAIGRLSCCVNTHELPATSFVLLKVDIRADRLTPYRLKGVYLCRTLIEAHLLEWVPVDHLFDRPRLRIRRTSRC